MTDSQDELEQIISRMTSIQRTIKASGQPPSMFELQDLKDLGIEYARLIEALSGSAERSVKK